MSIYRFYNANKFGNDIEDCTIRAISVAEGISWDKAYRNLSDYARERGLMLSSVEAIEEYLDDNYERAPAGFLEGLTVGEFAEGHITGTFLITMPNHITVLKDGQIYDTFDCTQKLIWDAWLVR